MGNLKKQIKAVERDLATQNRIIREQQTLLIHYVCTKQLLIIGLLGSFFTGFLLARKKTPTQLVRLALRLALKAEKLYLNLKLFFPLIKP